MATVVINILTNVRDGNARITLHGSTRVLEDKTTQLKVLT